MSQSPVSPTSRHFRSSALRARLAIALWVTACGLAAGSPVVAADHSAKGVDVAHADRVAPGQERKAAATTAPASCCALGRC